MTANWSKPNLEKWLIAWHLSRTFDCTINELLGIRNCDDCWSNRDKWIRQANQSGTYFECRDCKRFIGYEVREE